MRCPPSSRLAESAVIERLTDQPKRLFTDDYKDFLAANADYATDLAAMIGDFVDYGKTRDRLERLGNKLEIPRRGKLMYGGATGWVRCAFC